MTEDASLLVAKDPTVAKVAETALRMMAGCVGPDTLRALQDARRRSPDAYPWQEVCDLVVGESVDPSTLVNRGIVAQRDWLHKGGAGRPAAAAKPRRPVGNLVKRAIARLIVRGLFYAIFVLGFALVLVLVQQKWGWNLYEAAQPAVDFVRGLLGRG